MRIDFADGGVHDYAYVSSGDGPLLRLHDYVANLVTDVTTCRDAGRIAFAHCTPYVPVE
jgi:hypothetical protein